MQTHRSASCCRVVVLSYQTHICRAENALSDSHSDTPEDYEGNNATGKACKQGSRTENQCAEDDHFTTAQSVGIKAGKWHYDSIEHIEKGCNKSHSAVVGTEQCLNLRQYYVECLSVSLIQEECNPKQDYNFPFIERSACICR